MELTIIAQITQPYPRLRATVARVIPASDSVECPAQGEEITFYPETADYQHILRRKHWPAAGQTVRWRYIYLDGVCKNRGACRIKHHPVGW